MPCGIWRILLVTEEPLMDICIQIGNTDNKLTQQEWSEYIEYIYDICVNYGVVHFSGGSSAEKHFQNYCFCVSDVRDSDRFKNDVLLVRKDFRQDSLTWLQGEIDFI